MAMRQHKRPCLPHRLIVAVAYRLGVLYIKFVGTHAEYDKIDAANVEME